VTHFIRRTNRHLTPEFMHEERLFLEREREALHVMERHRDHLVDDIEAARSLAKKAHIAIDRPPPQKGRRLLALIGVGNHLRSDDGAGLEVARRLRLAHPPGISILESQGEPASLLEAWSDADEVLVVDGVSSGAEPGTLHRFEATQGQLPAELFRPSTHALGVAEAVELARELGRLPDRLVVYGIEGDSFEIGEGLTPAVEKAVAKLVTELYREFDR
jgi:hydrogenase maturation protease